jgi:hypothetical protein
MRLVGILILPALGIGAIVRICTENKRFTGPPLRCANGKFKMVPAEGVGPSLTAFQRGVSAIGLRRDGAA